MAIACDGFSRSEAGAISLISDTLRLDRLEIQEALLKVKCLFAANRPMRQRVHQALTQGIPWSDKEKLGTMLTALGAAVSFEVAALAMAGKLAAFGTSIAVTLTLPPSAGILVICAIVVICGIVLFHAIGEIKGLVLGLGDVIRGF